MDKTTVVDQTGTATEQSSNSRRFEPTFRTANLASLMAGTAEIYTAMVQPKDKKQATNSQQLIPSAPPKLAARGSSGMKQSPKPTALETKKAGSGSSGGKSSGSGKSQPPSLQKGGSNSSSGSSGGGVSKGQIVPKPSPQKGMVRPSILQASNSYMNGGLTIANSNGKDVLIHSKIYEAFGELAPAKISKNQTVLMTNSDETIKLDSVQSITEFLKKSSKYSHIEDVEKIAEGGEAVVYKINYMGFDEVVLKVPQQKYQNVSGFEDLIYESQLLKCIYEENYIVEVKEEIIEINTAKSQLQRYCVVVERAQFSLYDLYSFHQKPDGTIAKTGVWFNKDKSNKNLEAFSLQKLHYYFYKTMETLNYLHSIGIIYADMKPPNLLVMRNQKVKIGDFGISILRKQDAKQGQERYNLKGLSPKWVIPEISDAFKNAQAQKQTSKFYGTLWDTDLLLFNDVYGMCNAFSQELLNYTENLYEFQPDDNTAIEFFDSVVRELALKKTINTSLALKKIKVFYFENMCHLFKFMNQLKAEKKFIAAAEVANQVKQSVETSKELTAYQRNKFLFVLHKIQGEFHFYQGIYQEVLKEFVIVHSLIEIIRDEFVSVEPEGENQLAQNMLEMAVIEAKCHIYSGHTKEGEKCASLVFKIADENPNLKSNYQLSLLETRGYLELVKGNYPAALPYFMEYAEKSNALPGPDEHEPIFNRKQTVTNSFMHLGNIFYKLENYQQALVFFTKAKSLIQVSDGESHPQILDCLKAMGNIYLMSNNQQQAEVNFDEALAICKRVFGEKNVQTAESYRQLADLQNKQGLLERARNNYEKALSIFNEIYGERNNHSAVIYNNLGGLYEVLGDVTKARELCLRSLEIKSDLQGEDHIDIASVYQNLAQIFIREKKYNAAEEKLQKAYDIKAKGFGQNHLATIDTLMALGRISILLTDYEKAVERSQKAYDLIRIELDDKDPRAIFSQMYLATSMLKANMIDGGLKHLEECESRMSVLGQQPNYQSCYNQINRDLAMTYEQKGEEAKAIERYKKVLELDPDSIDTINYLKSLGWLSCKQKDFETGVAYLKKAEEMIEAKKDQISIMINYEQFLNPVRDMRVQCEEIIQKASTLDLQLKRPNLV